jgi:transcriptional regulator with GAF, ATPase, and Fis domain
VLRLGTDLLPLRTAPAPEETQKCGNASLLDDSVDSTLEQVERRHIARVLEQTSWVIEGDRGAAKVLDLHPNTLRSRMKKLGIERTAIKTTIPSALSSGRDQIPV